MIDIPVSDCTRDDLYYKTFSNASSNEKVVGIYTGQKVGFTTSEHDA